MNPRYIPNNNDIDSKDKFIKQFLEIYAESIRLHTAFHKIVTRYKLTQNSPVYSDIEEYKAVAARFGLNLIIPTNPRYHKGYILEDSIEGIRYGKNIEINPSAISISQASINEDVNKDSVQIICSEPKSSLINLDINKVNDSIIPMLKMPYIPSQPQFAQPRQKHGQYPEFQSNFRLHTEQQYQAPLTMQNNNQHNTHVNYATIDANKRVRAEETTQDANKRARRDVQPTQFTLQQFLSTHARLTNELTTETRTNTDASTNVNTNVQTQPENIEEKKEEISPDTFPNGFFSDDIFTDNLCDKDEEAVFRFNKS